MSDNIKLDVVTRRDDFKVVAYVVKSVSGSWVLLLRLSSQLRWHLGLAPGDSVVWFELDGRPCMARPSDIVSIDGRPLLGMTRVSSIRLLNVPSRALPLLAVELREAGQKVELEWTPVGVYACLEPVAPRAAQPPRPAGVVAPPNGRWGAAVYLPGWVRALTGINCWDTVFWYDYKGKPCIARLDGKPADWGTTASVSTSGRVTIPKKIRKTFNIKPGDKYQWIILDGHVCLDVHPSGVSTLKTDRGVEGSVV